MLHVLIYIIYVSIYRSLIQSIDPSIHPSTNPSIHLSNNSSIHPSIHQLNLSVCLSVCPPGSIVYFHRSICLSVLFIYLFSQNTIHFFLSFSYSSVLNTKWFFLIKLIMFKFYYEYY